MIPRSTIFLQFLALSTLLVSVSAARAQPSTMMRFEVEPLRDRSGTHRVDEGPLLDDMNRKRLEARYTTIVRSAGANLVRVHFDKFDLGAHSEVHLISIKDGAVQRFTHATLVEWDGWSAIFNGDTLLVQLLVAPGERAEFEIDQVAVNRPPLGGADGGVAGGGLNGMCGICDDTRVPSNDPRAGRKSATNCGGDSFCGGCTAWLASVGAALTAGHCGTGGVIEFNVPPSGANGFPVASHPDDQYPLGGAFAKSENAGVGADWAVVSVGVNANGQSAHWVQSHYHLSALLPAGGAALQVAGYGVDNAPQGSDPSQSCGFPKAPLFGCNSSSLTQQWATGTFLSGSNTTIEFHVPVTFANSGSAVARTLFASDIALGIVTNCSESDCSTNKATRLTQASLSQALNAFLSEVHGAATFVDNIVLSPQPLGTALHPAWNVPQGVDLSPAGGIVAIAGGHYPAASGNTGTLNKAVTLKAVSGVVTIGN